MALNFFRTAYLVDFGATLASLHAEQLQVLRSFGWTVVRSDTLAAAVACSEQLAVCFKPR